ncbi:D-alanyl-D-alanine carboxypeptidase [Corynebacterium qintianiae]|uniref:D-alanyl-D-alanine carboxypeptidase n=1 Tax=Corynebacterium qintianiae TaxID=2709392 RepID=A0A7T0KMY6_9CORY|nr:serine hydrolase [Corynebacterium qintianiae]QPK83630.1 D-alanyl-D-alanine carboxypeptidase [Corynebacterium qintianiae]
MHTSRSTALRVAAATACAFLSVAVPLAHAQEPTPSHSSRESMPDTESCPRATWPPEPVSTSEASVAGSTLTPLRVVYDGPCGISAPDGFTVGDKILASAWLVADVDSGEVVAMKDPHGRYRPASVIKVLLALVAIDELPLDRRVVVSAESANMEGSSAGIGAGGEYTVNDLLHGMLMASGNDTAHALAQELGGDAAALRKVNALAQTLGMHDTRVVTYSGLDGPGMSTSAWDMGLAYRAAFENETFARIVDTQSYPFPGFDDLPGFELWNDNNLYLNDPDGIGGKTGFTDDANHTFVGAVNHGGRRLVAVILDTTVERGRAWEQAQQLLHEAYNFPDDSVATLEAASANETTTPVTLAPDAKEPAVIAADSDAETFPWPSVGVVAAVLALAGAAAWASRATAGKANQRR